MMPPDKAAAHELPPGEDILSTRDVARLLVVSEATVKRWADDGLLRCYRTPGGHRKFSDRDVQLFMSERGFAPGAVRIPEATPGEALRLATAADLPKLELMANGALDGGLSLEALCDTVLVPALVEIGDRWACASASVAEEHVVSHSIVDLLARLRTRAERVPLHGKVAVVACAPGERHDLGARMVSLVLRSRGWATLDTGADAPTGDIITLARLRAASLVAVSASMTGVGPHSAQMVAAVLAAELKPPQVRVFAGGSAYEFGRLPDGVESARDLRSFARALELTAAG